MNRQINLRLQTKDSINLRPLVNYAGEVRGIDRNRSLPRDGFGPWSVSRAGTGAPTPDVSSYITTCIPPCIDSRDIRYIRRPIHPCRPGKLSSNNLLSDTWEEGEGRQQGQPGAAVAQTACQRSLQIKERERTNYGRKMEFLNMFYLIKIHILKIYSMPLSSCIQKKGTKSTDIELTFEFRVSM